MTRKFDIVYNMKELFKTLAQLNSLILNLALVCRRVILNYLFIYLFAYLFNYSDSLNYSL